jgi:malate synthase
LSILWEWLHKRAVVDGEPFTNERFRALLADEYAKLQAASDRDVYDRSKTTTLPVAREIVEAYVTDTTKMPWYIDLLNATLGVHDLEMARGRIRRLADAFRADGTRVTENLDFESVAAE